MFLVNDTIQQRRTRIRSFLKSDQVVAVLLAAADFEWTVRRAIIALSRAPNKVVRNRLAKCHGLKGYKSLWDELIKPYYEKGLHQIIPKWDRLNGVSYPLRDLIIHGIKPSTGKNYARLQVERILAASHAIVGFTSQNGYAIYGKRLPVKRKQLSDSEGHRPK